MSLNRWGTLASVHRTMILRGLQSVVPSAAGGASSDAGVGVCVCVDVLLPSRTPSTHFIVVKPRLLVGHSSALSAARQRQVPTPSHRPQAVPAAD